MAQSPIRIDTSVHGTKRGLSDDGYGDSENSSALESEGHAQGDTGLAGLPRFLNLPPLEIRRKFEDLEWLQRARITEGALAKDPSHRWALETDPEVRARNRYLNVQAWANARIHLRVPNGECDFINASPITVKDSVRGDETRYIATQGPKDGIHLSHFWHMVYHETKEVAVVVMLTQTIEMGREKCAQYFPLDLDDPTMELPWDPTEPLVTEEEHDSADEQLLGRITLLESDFEPACRSEIRKLELRIGSQSKIVWHFLFAGWADYSKPEGEDRDALLQLFKQTASKSSRDNPRIVHCSAGVGRTGTFIALDHLLRELESGELTNGTDFETDPVFDTVNQLREQRMMMVYNEMQLQFIYEVLREQCMIKLSGLDHDPSSELRSPKIARLSTEDDYTMSTKPELEPMTDPPTTPTRDWTATPEVSDIE